MKGVREYHSFGALLADVKTAAPPEPRNPRGKKARKRKRQPAPPLAALPPAPKQPLLTAHEKLLRLRGRMPQRR